MSYLTTLINVASQFRWHFIHFWLLTLTSWRKIWSFGSNLTTTVRYCGNLLKQWFKMVIFVLPFIFYFYKKKFEFTSKNHGF